MELVRGQTKRDTLYIKFNILYVYRFKITIRSREHLKKQTAESHVFP